MPVCFYGTLSSFRTISATTVAVDAFGRHGATHDLARRGVGWGGRESVMAMGGFRWNFLGPPEWDEEAMDSVVWVKCTTSAECI